MVDEATLVHVAELLRIDTAAIADANWVDNGPGWIGVLLESADAELALASTASPTSTSGWSVPCRRLG